MKREKEKEDAKRRDVFLHISDAELLGNLPVDGRINKVLYDEVKKKQEQLRQLKLRNEKELQRRDKLEAELEKIDEKRYRLKHQGDINEKLLENEEHLIKLTEAEKKSILKELIEAKINFHDKAEKVKALKNICESQRRVLQVSPFVVRQEKWTKANSISYNPKPTVMSLKKALERENKNGIVLSTHRTALRKQQAEKQKELDRLEEVEMRLQKEIEEAKEKQDQLDGYLSLLKEKHSDILKEIDSTRKVVEKKEEEATKARKARLKVEEIEAEKKIECNKRSEQMEKVSQKLTKEEKMVTALDEKLKAAEKRWEHLQDVLSQMESNILSALMEKAKEEKEYETIKRKVSDLESEVFNPSTSKEHISSPNCNGDSYKAFTSESTRSSVLSKLQHEAEELEEKSKNMKSSLQEIEESNNKLNAEIMEAETVKAKLEVNILKLNEEINFIKQDNELKKRQNEEQSNKIKEMRKKLSELANDKKGTVKKQKSLKLDLRQLDQTAINYAAKLAFLTQNKSSNLLSVAQEKKTTETVAELRDRIKLSEEELKTLEAVLAAVNDKNKMVRTQLSTVKPYYEEQSKLASLKAEEEKLKEELQIAKTQQKVMQIKKDGDILMKIVEQLSY